MIDPAIIIAAFLGGLVALSLRLPPLVGFLAGGFALNFLGIAPPPLLGVLADVGVTLLLFSIGLKLDIRTLLRRDVWGGASLHMLVSTLMLVAMFTASRHWDCRCWPGRPNHSAAAGLCPVLLQHGIRGEGTGET